MPGIYGPDPEDRGRERQLDRYLQSLDEPIRCPSCGSRIYDDGELCTACQLAVDTDEMREEAKFYEADDNKYRAEHPEVE